MDDSEDDSEYSMKAYGVNNRQKYGSSFRSKVPAHSSMYSRGSSQYGTNEEDEVEEERGNNGVQIIGKDNYDDDDDGTNDDDDDEEDEDADGGDIGIRRPRKKRKLKTLLSNYEFAPRIPAPPPQPSSSVGRNSSQDWTERETLALLDAWGDQFLKLGRKSLRSQEWQEVVEKLFQGTNVERTETQCRNRLDTLKRKYRKEKMKLIASNGGATSKWVFYRRMDMLMFSPPQSQSGLSCGIDSGEYVFMNPKVYLNRANGFDEMRDSPDNSEDSSGGEEDSDGLPPPKGKRSKRRKVDDSSFGLLADSFEKFSGIYEKIEINRRKQLSEIEKMRMDFQREMETQRKQLFERVQAEIAKIRRGDEDENDLS